MCESLSLGRRFRGAPSMTRVCGPEGADSRLVANALSFRTDIAYASLVGHPFVANLGMCNMRSATQQSPFGVLASVEKGEDTPRPSGLTVTAHAGTAYSVNFVAWRTVRHGVSYSTPDPYRTVVFVTMSSTLVGFPHGPLALPFQHDDSDVTGFAPA